MIKQIAATVTALLLVGVLVALVGHEHSASASENFATTAFDTELAVPQCQSSMQGGCETCDTTKTVVGKGYDVTRLLDPDIHTGMRGQLAFEDEAQEPDDVTWRRLSESRCTDERIDTQSMGKVAAQAAAAMGFTASGGDWGLSLGSNFNENIAAAYKSNKQVSLNTCTIKNFRWEITGKDRGQASQTIMNALARLKEKDSQALYNGFFDVYGTHVITAAAYGGRYTMKAEYGTFECNSTGTVCAGATFGAMFGKVVGISGGGSTCTSSQKQEEVTSAKLTSIIVGGSADAQAELRNFALNPGNPGYVNPPIGASLDFENWEASLECHPELVSMTLVPVGSWLSIKASGCTTLGGACPSAVEWEKALQAYVESQRYPAVTPPAPCTGGGGGGGVSCFSDNNTVLASSSRKMLVGEVQVGDRLNTTIEDDEVTLWLRSWWLL